MPHARHLPARRHLLVLAAAGLLAACASTPPTATVQVYTPPPQLAAGTAYRHERLPSQAGQAAQATLEGLADTALARAGLRRDEANARLAVQVTVTQEPGAMAPGWGGPSVGIGIGSGGFGSGVGVGFGIPIGGGGMRPARQRVDVQLRDLQGGRVLWQAQASGDADPATLLEAALRDFPQGGAGTRQVPLGQPAR